MTFETLYIGGNKVETLYINGVQVDIGGEPPVTLGPLCFTAQEANSTIGIQAVGSAPSVSLKTSVDGSTWNSYTVGDTITLANVGDKVYFKADGSNDRMGYYDYDYNNFVMTGKIAASGNVNSLLNENEETASTMSLADKYYCYYGLFDGCTSLTTPPELPSTILESNCYTQMFNGCTSLTQAPELPATTLDENCYQGMFYGCTSLTTPPELPDTKLYPFCYSEMFYNCTSLKVSNTQVEGGVKFLESYDQMDPYGWNMNMFVNTGGTFTGSPQIGTAYYYYQ